ncbi:MAG: polysaccharide deacetylase family protein [Planctomycetota bacterium]
MPNPPARLTRRESNGLLAGPAATRRYPQAVPSIRAITIDVEEAFHAQAAQGVTPPATWRTLPRRVEHGMDILLDTLADRGIRPTLFVLGDVARAHPALIRRWADQGCEIACHGDRHQRLHELGPRGFLRDARNAKARLEDLAGRPVRGYRAPSWSLTRRTPWAPDILRELGFDYDSSVFPVRHPSYGIPDAPLTPHPLRPGLLEVPPLVWQTPWNPAHRLAAAGGAYFRVLPLGLMTRAFRQAQAADRPAVLYFHPWEFDPGQPRLPLPRLQRLRTYAGVARAPKRLAKLLDRLEAQGETWKPLSEQIAAARTPAGSDATVPTTSTNPYEAAAGSGATPGGLSGGRPSTLAA